VAWTERVLTLNRTLALEGSRDGPPHDERVQTDQHSRSDEQPETLSSRGADLGTESLSSVEADDNRVATHQRFYGTPAPLHIPAAHPESSEPRDNSGSQDRSADNEHQPIQTGHFDEAAPNTILAQAAAYRQEDGEGSADSSGAGTSTILNVPEPTGRRQFTMDELRDLQGSPAAGTLNTSYDSEDVAKQTGNAVSPAATNAWETSLTRDTPTAPSSQDSTETGKGPQTSSDTQAIPPHSSEPCESTGVQDMSADAGRQLVQSDGDDVAGENFTNPLEQTGPSRWKDGEENTGGSSAEGMAHISDAALVQHLAPEVTETTMTPAANLARVSHEAKVENSSDFGAHQPYQLRISKAIGDRAIGESGKPLHAEELDIVIEEISWVPIHLLTFVESVRLPIGDRLKGFVEDRMHGEGD
jgi:hypothetical protein